MAGCTPQMGQAVADRMSSLVENLERVTRERDAAIACIRSVATYVELGSAKYIKKTIDAWENGQKGAET